METKFKELEGKLSSIYQRMLELQKQNESLSINKTELQSRVKELDNELLIAKKFFKNKQAVKNKLENILKKFDKLGVN